MQNPTDIVRVVDLRPSPGGTCRIYARLVQGAMDQNNPRKRRKILTAVRDDLMRMASALDREFPEWKEED